MAYYDSDEYLTNRKLIRENKLAELRKKPTRQLLKMLRECMRGYGIVYNNTPDDGYTHAEIKQVLQCREHIPNKLEARKIRQIKAKARV